MTPIFLQSIASISSLGSSSEEIWESYLKPQACFSARSFQGKKVWVAQLSRKEEDKLKVLAKGNSFFEKLDKTVLQALYAARKATANTNTDWSKTGINIGSSRGATRLFEKYHASFLESGRAETLASPTTTLGNIATWVAQDLGSQGPVFSHSVACSTASQSFLNGIAWLQSGMCDDFLVGGSEAPLTDFTIAQMQALKLYSREQSDFPCGSLKFDKKENSMILGEAAAVAHLSKKNVAAAAKIIGVGFATEKLTHNISLSSEADCVRDAMRRALQSADVKEVDVVVMHAPGTSKGDNAEYKAIENTFSTLPALTSNKWKIGHSFGASGIMSIEMAVLMLQKQKFIENPFYSPKKIPSEINTVLVNAVGFGGNAVSLLLEKI